MKRPPRRAHRFGQGRTPDAGHGPIHDAGVLVHDRQLGAQASSRARLTRNCSPVLSTRNGRSHAGGEEKPTDDSRLTTSFTGSAAGKASSTARSSGQAGHCSCAASASPNRCRTTVDLPQPDGPTISPTFQGLASSGSATSRAAPSPTPPAGRITLRPASRAGSGRRHCER